MCVHWLRSCIWGIKLVWWVNGKKKPHRIRVNRMYNYQRTIGNRNNNSKDEYCSRVQFVCTRVHTVLCHLPAHNLCLFEAQWPAPPLPSPPSSVPPLPSSSALPSPPPQPCQPAIWMRTPGKALTEWFARSACPLERVQHKGVTQALPLQQPWGRGVPLATPLSTTPL